MAQAAEATTTCKPASDRHAGGSFEQSPYAFSVKRRSEFALPSRILNMAPLEVG